MLECLRSKRASNGSTAGKRSTRNARDILCSSRTLSRVMTRPTSGHVEELDGNKTTIIPSDLHLSPNHIGILCDVAQEYDPNNVKIMRAFMLVVETMMCSWFWAFEYLPGDDRAPEVPQICSWQLPSYYDGLCTRATWIETVRTRASGSGASRAGASGAVLTDAEYQRSSRSYSSG